MSTEISFVPAPRNTRAVYALYDVHEMSRPQLMRGLMNVLQSMYFKALTKDFITVIPVTDIRAVPSGSAVLVYSSAIARRFIGSGSMQNYRGSVYHADGLVYIIGIGIGGMRCLLISSPKDDAQEKMVVKMFYATASDIYKAYRFNRGDFDGYAMHTDDTLDYMLIREPQEWDSVKAFIDSRSDLLAISFDIETAGFPTFISAFGFTLVLGTVESPRFKSYTIAMGIHSYCWHHTAMRYICSHPAPKIAHNGAYDCTVLLRFRIPVANMLYDTMLMHHSIRCDALKSLAYVASTLLPDYVFWKGEIKGVENKGNEGKSETQLETETKDHGVPPTPEGRIVYYKYCAKDTYYTARICLELLKLFHATSWAVRNYCLVHFLQYRVGIFMGLAGMPIDKTKFKKFVADICTERDTVLSQLRTYAKDELFNPGSTSEVQNFLYVTLGLPLPTGIRLKPAKKPRSQKHASVAAQKLLGMQKAFGSASTSSSPFSSGAKPLLDPFGDDMFASFDELKEAASKSSSIPEDLSRYPTDKTAVHFLIDQNPGAREPLEMLLRYRWLQKVISNYLLSTTLLVDSVNDPNIGVLLYHPSICATVTCRYGGGKSNLGWGAYHLNLPPGLWDCIKVPAGHLRYSIDYSHSDDYFVAFYSGVPTMMENVVRTDLDLHMKHASLIFQRPYDYLMEHKKDKESEAPLLRKLTKSIGHGCKYLMGGYTMYTHMGDPNICAAIDALRADVDKSSLPEKTRFASHLQDLFYAQYEGLTKWHKDVYMQLLQNPERTITVGNWTRQILSPANWFSVHSGSVAQYGQAGTSSNSNAFLRKFFRRKLDPSSYIFAQVHDAMDGFARNEDEVREIAALMEEPITVTDIYGTTRTFSVATETETFKPTET